VQTNFIFAELNRWTRAGLLDRSAARDAALSRVRRYHVRCAGLGQPVELLSGGNQQKIVVGRAAERKADIYLFDEPTRGVDIGAKQEIYRLMEELAESGVAVLFVSSEMAEIIGMSDRALVMHEGRITGELQHDQVGEEAIMQLATGRTEKITS
jgi:ribose transport system ATP-binding protein